MRVWRLASGEEVRDRDPSHVHAGVTDELLSLVLSQIRVADGQARVKHTHDFGRVVGASNCVSTQVGDDIVFAQRVHRDGLSRFVKNRAPEPTTLLTLTVQRGLDGQFVLRTAYLGGPGHIEPWAAGPDRLIGSIAFWSAHALCWGFEPIIIGTVTAVCPW